MTKVFINPGHDRDYDSGAVSPRTGLRECDVAFEVGELVEKYLQNAGCETMSIQSDNLYGERPELPCVTDTANDWEADLFVSIHCNAFNTLAHGTETLCFSANSEGGKLANYIQTQLIDSIGTADRGVIERRNLVVLKRTDMPAVLVELAFIDNEDDEEVLVNMKDEMARAIARGVTDYLSNA